MENIFTVLFLTLLNWIIVSAETSIIKTVSNIEESHKTILANINYQLELNRAIPGEPDRDYPVHSSVPVTTFSCIGKLEGYYADIESRCQAFRICTNTAISSQGFGFLCPNGTLFSQKLLVCDWYRNVKCNDSTLYYNNSNVEVGSEFTIMKTIRLMMEYPIKMFKIEEPPAELKNGIKQKNYTQNFYDYENPNQSNGSILLINNLGELSPDNSINYIVKNGTSQTNTTLTNKINDINLAININNLAEAEVISGTIHKDSDSTNKQPFRFLSQEFSNHKLENEVTHERINHSIDHNTLYDINQRKNHNKSNTTTESVTLFMSKNYTPGNIDNSKLDVEYDFNTAPKSSNSTEVMNTNINEKIKDNTEYLKNYSSNLLLSGIIQSSIEPKIHEHYGIAKNKKHFKNFFNKRNLQQTFITTRKMPLITTTKNPQFNFKENAVNRLHPLISQTSAIKEKYRLEHSSISKKSVHNINTGSTNLSNVVMNGSDFTYQPTWESVRKNLMRYQIRNSDISQSSRKYSNRKITPSSLLATNTNDSLFNTFGQKLIPTYKNTFISYDDSNIMNSSNDPLSNISPTHSKKGNLSRFSQDSVIAGAQEQPISRHLIENNNMKSKSDSQKNYISLKEFFIQKFGDETYIH